MSGMPMCPTPAGRMTVRTVAVPVATKGSAPGGVPAIGSHSMRKPLNSSTESGMLRSLERMPHSPKMSRGRLPVASAAA
jgi:hypothetical protein